jgi:hypothetical protein
VLYTSGGFNGRIRDAFSLGGTYFRLLSAVDRASDDHWPENGVMGTVGGTPSTWTINAVGSMGRRNTFPKVANQVRTNVLTSAS